MIGCIITTCVIGLSAIWWPGHSSDPLNSRMVLGKAEMDARPNAYFQPTPGQYVTGMAAADIDEHGTIRLFTLGCKSSGWNQGWLTMWRYNANGTLTKIWEASESDIGDWTHRPLTVPAIGDMDGDGLIEVIVAWGKARIVKSYEPPGSEAYEWFLGLAGDELRYSSPAIGDVDGDGKPEVVIGTEAGNLYVCKFNDWNPAPAVPAPFPNAAVRSSPALADLDENGVLDIVFCVSHKTSGIDQAYVYAYTWNGTAWQKMWEYSAPDPNRKEFFCDPAIGDIDNDGVLDVVVIMGAGPTSMQGYPVALNGRDGTEKWRQTSVEIPPASEGIEHPRSVALADMDGDKLLEVVCFNGRAVYYLDGATGSIESSVYPLAEGCPCHITKPLVLDVDGDGSLEVVVQSCAHCDPYKPGTWCVDWNSVEWAFDSDNPPTINSVHFSGPIAIDADGDELLEVFLQNGDKIVAFDNDVSLSPYWRRLLAPLGFKGKVWDASCTPVMVPNRQDTLFFPHEFTGNAVAVGELQFLFFLPIIWRRSESTNWEWATMTTWPVHKYCLYGVHMIGEGKGYAVGRGAMFLMRPRWKSRLLETTDGGRTWTDVSERLPGGGFEPWPLLDIYFSDAKHGYIVGARGWIYKTTDGGLTWTTPFQKPTPENLQGVYCYGSQYGAWNHIWVVGENGSIFYNDQGMGPWISYSFIPSGYTSCDYEAAILDLWRQNPLLPPTPRERKDTVYIVGHGIRNGVPRGLVLFTHDRVISGWSTSEEGQGLWDINTHVDYSARRYLSGLEYIYSMAGNRVPSSPVYGDYFESGAMILGLADNYPLAGGYTSGGRPFIVEKIYGSPEPGLEEPPAGEPYEPRITAFFDPQSGYAFLEWPWDTSVLDVGYSLRIYPMGTTTSDWENPHLRNWHILEPFRTDSGYWDRYSESVPFHPSFRNLAFPVFGF